MVLEAEQQFPDVPSAAWRRTGERFDEFTDTGRPGRRLTRTLSDRARALAIAAERPEPPASPGLVKRLFEWLRERVRKMLHKLRPPKAAHHQDRSGDGGVQPARAAAAEQARQERRQARKLITAARAAARKWGDIPLATGTAVSVAESISARPRTSAAHRAVLEQIREAAPRSSLSTEAAALRRRCLAEKDAAADQRHQQALGEWEAQSWPRRRMAERPRREHPDPPDRHDLAAARDQLVRVVRSAMITELEKLMPQRRPASPTRGRRTNAARRSCGSPRPLPAAFEAAPERWPGRASCRGAAPGSGPHPGHAAQAGAGHVAARPRLRETGDMNQAADRYPRRVGRVLPGDLPVPLCAAGRRLRSLWTVPPVRYGAHSRPPETRPIGEHSGGLGGLVRSIHHVTRPLAPRPRSISSGRLPPGRRKGKNRARFARFFFAALCAARGRWAGGPTTQGM